MLTKRPTTSIADIRRLAGRLSGRDVPKLLVFAENLEAVRKAAAISSELALRAVRVDVGLGDTMDVLDGSRREADRSTHGDDLLALESVAALHTDAATFEPWLRDVLRVQASGDGVLLSTIHKIKGREWDYVVLFGASSGLLPHRLSDDVEGERRVFHVAITRARRQVLVLAGADSPSPFVAELDGTRPREPLQSRSGRSQPVRPKPDNSRGRGTPEGQRQGRRSSAAPPVPRLPTMRAAVGLELEHGGYHGTVVEIADDEARLQVGSVRLPVPFGADILVSGVRMTLVAPDGGLGTTLLPPAEAEAALRAWRSAAAKQAKVPAYVLLHDRELAIIASHSPRTLAELARCPGMGPVRLERWGDEIIAVLDRAQQND
jgi:hypothetical protein